MTTKNMLGVLSKLSETEKRHIRYVFQIQEGRLISEEALPLFDRLAIIRALEKNVKRVRSDPMGKPKWKLYTEIVIEKIK